MATRVLLDTCVVRNHVHSFGAKLDAAEIAAHADDIKVSIADSAFAELLSQLLEGRLSFSDWVSGIPSLDLALDVENPVFPSGYELLAMWGHPSIPSVTLCDNRLYYRTIWHLLRSATCVSDLKREIIYTDSGGLKVIRCDEDMVKEKLEGYRNRWVNDIRNISKATKLARTATTAGRLERTDLSPEDQLDRLADRLECVIKCVDQFVQMSLTEDHPYNPDSPKRAGDVFDVELLYALALPAILCTADEKLHNRVKQLDCKQVSQVVLIEEFNEHLRRGTLPLLVR